MSESLERRLSAREWAGLRLHLLVCAWCARYLKQIRLFRTLLRRPQLSEPLLASTLGADARERIAKSLKGHSTKS